VSGVRCQERRSDNEELHGYSRFESLEGLGNIGQFITGDSAKLGAHLLILKLSGIRFQHLRPFQLTPET
jgi:hypothetical protein